MQAQAAEAGVEAPADEAAAATDEAAAEPELGTEEAAKKPGRGLSRRPRLQCGAGLSDAGARDDDRTWSGHWIRLVRRASADGSRMSLALRSESWVGKVPWRGEFLASDLPAWAQSSMDARLPFGGSRREPFSARLSIAQTVLVGGECGEC